MLFPDHQLFIEIIQKCRYFSKQTKRTNCWDTYAACVTDHQIQNMCIAPSMNVTWASCFYKCLKTRVNSTYIAPSNESIIHCSSVRFICESEFCSRVRNYFPLELFTFTRRTNLSLALSPTTYLRTMANLSWDEMFR